MRDIKEKKVDAKKVIKDLAKAYGDTNEDQGKMVQLLRGLAFSDQPEANTFMKALDKWTTQQSKKMFENQIITIHDDNTIIEIQEKVKIPQGNKNITLEKGDKIEVLNEEN